MATCDLMLAPLYIMQWLCQGVLDPNLNFCCGTTAQQAYERGFKVIFGSDITATDDPAMQEPELQVLSKGFAKVLSLDEILEQLSRR